DCSDYGIPVKPTRIARGLSWVMLGFGLRDRCGSTVSVSVDPASTKSVEGVLVMDRPMHTMAANDDPRLPEPLGQDFLRQSVHVLEWAPRRCLIPSPTHSWERAGVRVISNIERLLKDTNHPHPNPTLTLSRRTGRGDQKRKTGAVGANVN
ncbi:MAG TPA: hypothetical protein VLI90_02440, partial [Tepidisphaeraceae bacterium]|nr:hypothetical protein [Tepidisphaeraceae bacterium]